MVKFLKCAVGYEIGKLTSRGHSWRASLQPRKKQIKVRSVIKFNLVLTAIAFALACGKPLHAQSQPVQYFYDDLGQLTKVVDSTGTIIEYVYDPVGNILQVRRSTAPAGTLAVFNFTPQRGGPGQTVTIQGQGFGATLGANNVQFNGAPAIVTSASPTTLVATVPVSATTGPILAASRRC
jgi:YD repeat-containing protein